MEGAWKAPGEARSCHKEAQGNLHHPTQGSSHGSGGRRSPSIGDYGCETAAGMGHGSSAHARAASLGSRSSTTVRTDFERVSSNLEKVISEKQLISNQLSLEKKALAGEVGRSQALQREYDLLVEKLYSVEKSAARDGAEKETQIDQLTTAELLTREELARSLAENEESRDREEQLRQSSEEALLERGFLTGKLGEAERDCRELGEECARLTMELAREIETRRTQTLGMETQAASHEKALAALAEENRVLQAGRSRLMGESEAGAIKLRMAEADYAQHTADMESLTKEIGEIRSAKTMIEAERLAAYERSETMEESHKAALIEMEARVEARDEASREALAQCREELAASLLRLEGTSKELSDAHAAGKETAAAIGEMARELDELRGSLRGNAEAQHRAEGETARLSALGGDLARELEGLKEEKESLEDQLTQALEISREEGERHGREVWALQAGYEGAALEAERRRAVEKEEEETIAAAVHEDRRELPDPDEDERGAADERERVEHEQLKTALESARSELAHLHSEQVVQCEAMRSLQAGRDRLSISPRLEEVPRRPSWPRIGPPASSEGRKDAGISTLSSFLSGGGEEPRSVSGGDVPRLDISFNNPEGSPVATINFTAARTQACLPPGTEPADTEAVTLLQAQLDELRTRHGASLASEESIRGLYTHLEADHKECQTLLNAACEELRGVFAIIQANPEAYVPAKAQGSPAASEDVSPELMLESTQLREMVLALHSHIPNHSHISHDMANDMAKVATEVDIIEAKFETMQRSSKEQHGTMRELEGLVDMFEVEVDAAQQRRHAEAFYKEQTTQILELQHRTQLYERETKLSSVQSALELSQERCLELSLSSRSWEQRYLSIERQSRLDRAEAASQHSGVVMERDQLRLTEESLRSEATSCRMHAEQLQAAMMQLRLDKTESILSTEMAHEVEMDRLRGMLTEASDKENSLIGAMQEAKFASSLEIAELVRSVQDLGRIVGRMKEMLGQALGISIERSKLLDSEEITLEAITEGTMMMQAHTEMNEVSRRIGEHKAKMIHHPAPFRAEARPALASVTTAGRINA